MADIVNRLASASLDGDYSKLEKPKKIYKPRQKWKVVKKKRTKKVDIQFGCASFRPLPIRQKTRMCYSVLNGGVCKHGADCRFAHSLKELVIPKCHFGKRCRCVENVNGVWKNIPSQRECARLHPNETTEEFHKRLGWNVKKRKRSESASTCKVRKLPNNHVAESVTVRVPNKLLLTILPFVATYKIPVRVIPY